MITLGKPEVKVLRIWPMLRCAPFNPTAILYAIISLLLQPNAGLNKFEAKLKHPLMQNINLGFSQRQDKNCVVIFS